MPSPRKRLPANSGGEVTQADKPGSKPRDQPPRGGDSQDGEISDADNDERPSDPVTHRDIIQMYWKPALEIMVLVIVFYLLYPSSPDNTERALLDVLKEKCGKSPSETKTCIRRLLSSKTSCTVPEDVPKTKQVTPDCSHLESEYRKLEHTVDLLRKWTEGIESVFKDPSQMSEPLKTLKDHHRHLETMSSAGKGNDVADLTQVEADVKTITEANKAVSKTLHETNTNLAEVRSTLAETGTHLTETNTKFGKLEDRINKLQETQNNLMEIKIPGIESKMGDIRGKAIEAREATEENGGRLQDYIKQSNSAYEEFKKHRDATNEKVEEFAGKHDTAERKLDGEELDGAMTKAELSQLKGKSTLHDIALYLTLLNIIAVVIVVMYVRQTLSSASAPVSTPAAFHNNTQRGFRREEVYELSWAGPMEDTLCVVTFHTETELKHADQTRSVFESQKQCPTIYTRVIRCHADIKQLPGSRVFLVFVDFNERNVILEDPTKGLGDLRVTTVRSLWKFGADVAVIYCGDRGSANLGGGLFNKDLGSIHRQKELTQLKKDDRILSISSDFNNTQKQHCRNYINRLLHIAH